MKYFGEILHSFLKIHIAQMKKLILCCLTPLWSPFSCNTYVCWFYRIYFAETLVYWPLDLAESGVPKYWLPSPLFPAYEHIFCGPHMAHSCGSWVWADAVARLPFWRTNCHKKHKPQRIHLVRCIAGPDATC